MPARAAVSAECGGFTLLEIMLVLAIMAVAVAMVVPEFFSGRSTSLNDEARRLQMAMRLAAEDAQVYGVPVRWAATVHAYRFEKWDTAGTWDVVDHGPLRPHALPAGIGIAGVKQAQGPSMILMMPPMDATDAPRVDGERAVGQVLFWPDGSLTMADIELARDGAGVHTPSDSRRLHLRPGLGGIRLADAGG